MTVPQRLTMVTLGVADVARSTEFYEGLGWNRSSTSQETITFFKMQGSVLGLFQREALAEDAAVESVGSGFRGVTCALNCADRADVDAVFAAWVEAGATAVKLPEEVFWGRLFVLRRRPRRSPVGDRPQPVCAERRRRADPAARLSRSGAQSRASNVARSIGSLHIVRWRRSPS